MNRMSYDRVHGRMECAGIFRMLCTSLTAAHFAGAPFSFSTSGRVLHSRHVADLSLFGMMADGYFALCEVCTIWA